MKCAETHCERVAMENGRFCVECFQIKWGMNPIEYVPLPKCLTDIVDGYLSSTFEECSRNLNSMYLQSRTCSSMFVFETFRETMSINGKVMYFIADRYCRSKQFWKHLKNWFGDPYKTFLFSRVDLARVFEPYHPINFTDSFLEKIIDQHDDDSMLWWILNLKRVHCPPIHECMFRFLFQKLLFWQSKRVLQYFIDIGLFAIAETARVFLQKAALVKNGWHMFLDVWNIHYSNIFLPKHLCILETALETFNVPILDFLSALKHVNIGPCTFDFLAHLLNCRPEIRAWVIHNQHIVNGEFAFEPTLDCQHLIELYDAGMFASFDTLTNIILKRNDVNILILKTRYGVSYLKLLLTILSRMNHLGTKQQLRTTVRLMCNHLSFSDFNVVLSVPVVKQHVTFAVLRNAKFNFLYQLVATAHLPTGFNLTSLDWLASWRDIEQQTLSLKDVFAKNKALLRFARETNNTELQEWIKKFIQQKRKH